MNHFEYTHHPVNNHQYLDFGEEHKWRKLDWAKSNMKRISSVVGQQNQVQLPPIEAHYTKAEVTE